MRNFFLCLCVVLSGCGGATGIYTEEEKHPLERLLRTPPLIVPPGFKSFPERDFSFSSVHDVSRLNGGERSVLEFLGISLEDPSNIRDHLLRQEGKTLLSEEALRKIREELKKP